MLVIVAYSVANVMIQSLLRPKFVGDAVGLSVTLAFLSLVFWTFVIGPLGALLAVPLSLFAKALLVDADPDSRAALFVVISGGADPGRAIEALAPLGPWVLRTNLDPAAEQRLLAAFTEPAPRPGSTSPSPPASE